MNEQARTFWRMSLRQRLESIRDRLWGHVYYGGLLKADEVEWHNEERSRGQSRMSPRTPEDVLRAAIERPHHRKHSGSTYLVHPKLVTEIFGDGKELLILTPCVTSIPNYYVVRTGTGWTKGSRWGDDSDAPIRDHIPDIYDAIREEYGEVEYEDQGEYHEGNEDEWPLLDLTIGCSWGVDKWPFKSEATGS